MECGEQGLKGQLLEWRKGRKRLNCENQDLGVLRVQEQRPSRPAVQPDSLSSPSVSSVLGVTALELGLTQAPV